MSIHIIGEVWDHSRSSGTARLVLLALADYADRESRLAWPSKREVARRTKVNERSVQRALRELERLGEIELVEAGGPPDRTARYRIVPQTAEGRQSDPTQRRGGDTAGAERGHPRSGVGSPASPDPLEELSGEPSSSSSAREPAFDQELPKDFPVELRAALDAVWPAIERIAEAKGSSAPPSRAAVARAIASFPDRDHVDAATDLEQWLVHGTGRETQIADVVQSYRRTLARARRTELAAAAPTASPRRDFSRFDRAVRR